MLELIAGNACSLIATGTDAFSSSRKTARGVLLVQVLSQLLYGIGSVILKGYSAAVQNFVSILRNLAAVQKRRFKILEWVLIALAVGLGVWFNNRGSIGLLPVLANLEYSLAVYFFQDNELALKAVFLLDVALFCVLNVVILNIVGAISNIVVVILTSVFLIREWRNRKKVKT